MIDTVNLARLGELAQNAEQVTFGQRQGAAGPDGPDSFTSFTLYAAQRRTADRGDLDGTQFTVSDEVLVWQLVQTDLSQANAPAPLKSYTLTDGAGVVWVIEKVRVRYFGMLYECVCRKGR